MICYVRVLSRHFRTENRHKKKPKHQWCFMPKSRPKRDDDPNYNSWVAF